MKRLSVIALVFAVFAANAAYDYYWFGTAGDGLWTNAVNWSSTPDSYTAVANGYPRSSSFNVHIDTSVAADHHVTINIPKLASNPPKCGALEIFDSTGSGSLTFLGEANESGRTGFPLGDNLVPIWTATGHPMRFELLNLKLCNGTLSAVENECAGCSVLVSNCVGTATGNSYYMHLPGQHGGTVVIIDSEITTQRLNGTAAIDVAGYVFAVTNSTIRIGADCYIGGPGTLVDFFNSTLVFGTLAPSFGAANLATTNEHPNMKISFRNSTIVPGKKFAYFLSAGGSILFDNVVQSGNCKGFELGGIATTELRNTSFRFCDTTSNGYRGISGDLILDNSEWLSTNSSQNIALNGPLRVEFRGRAPRFGGRQFSGSYPVTFDFLVPKGGYAYPPVNRMDNPATGINFPSSAVGGSINVLPESPAIKVPGTLIQPLVYVKDSKSSQPVCQLANLLLTTLPNEKSKFLVATDYSWEYEDVNDKVESDWAEVAVGYNKAVAGVAVKIVGLKPGLSIFVR